METCPKCGSKLEKVDHGFMQVKLVCSHDQCHFETTVKNGLGNLLSVINLLAIPTLPSNDPWK